MTTQRLAQIERIGCTLATEQSLKPRLVDADEFKTYIRSVLPSLSKIQMEGLTAEIRKYYITKFKRRRRPKYGTLNKGFTERELAIFMRAVDHPKYRLLFEYQANLGLRIGEACKVNIRDLKLEERELVIRSEKTKLTDTLRIPLPLFKETLDYVRAHSAQIEASGGYLFFKDTNPSGRKEPFLEVNYVRNRFGTYLKDAGLDEVYDISEETNQARRPRRLHRLTTHSLRHFAITRFAKSANGNLILTSRFARHVDPSTTNIYIKVNNADVGDVIDSIAIGEVALMKKKLVS